MTESSQPGDAASRGSAAIPETGTETARLAAKSYTAGGRRRGGRHSRWLGIAKSVLRGRGDHRVPVLAGGIAYFMLVSLAPLVTVIAFFGARLLRDSDGVSAYLYEYVAGSLGPEAVKFFQDLVESEPSGTSTTVGVVVGLLVALWAASLVFTRLKDAIDSIWGLTLSDQRTMVADRLSTRETRSPAWVTDRVGQDVTTQVIGSAAGIAVWVIRKAAGMLVVLGLGVALVLTVAIVAALGSVNSMLPEWLSGAIGYGNVLVWGTAALLISGGLTMLFRYMPATKVRFSSAAAGGVFAGVTMIMFNVGFGTYLSWATSRGVGATTSAVLVFLLWMYLQVQVLLTGVELSRAVEEDRQGR